MGIILQKIYDSASFDSLVKSWRNTNRHVSQYCIKYISSTLNHRTPCHVSDDLNFATYSLIGASEARFGYFYPWRKNSCDDKKSIEELRKSYSARALHWHRSHILLKICDARFARFLVYLVKQNYLSLGRQGTIYESRRESGWVKAREKTFISS